MRDRSADRAAVAHLVVAHLGGDRAQHAALRASRSLVSTSRWRVSAPMAMWSPASRTYDRSCNRPTSTTTVGVASRSFMSGSSDMPPASSFASSPCSMSCAMRGVGGVGPHVFERGGDHRRRLHLVGRREHRLDDVVVAGAAAEVALDADAHVALGRFGISSSSETAAITMPAVQYPHWSPWCSWNAVCTGCHSSPSARPSMVVTRRAVGLRGEHRARLHRLAVDEHRARAARRRVAADLGAGEPARLPQEVHEQGAVLDFVRLRGAVDGDRRPSWSGASIPTGSGRCESR